MTTPSFSHVADHPHIRAIERALAADPASLVHRDFMQVADLARHDAERSHREAAMIMHEYQVTKRPFGLYLRSFEPESYHYFSPDVVPGRDGGTVTTTLSGPSSVETKLARSLTGRLPMLAVANPSQLLTHRGEIPRLQLRSEGWQHVVQNLVEHAHLIVMDCDALASGVIWELETIAALDRQDATVIILPAEGSDAKDNTMQTVAEVFGAVVQRQPRATKDAPPLAATRRVAYENEVNFDRIDESPLFADLLAAADAKAADAPAFDASAYGRMLNNEGVKLMDNRQFAEAFNLHTQALLVRRQIDDREGILVSLRNLGIVCTDAGDPAQALPYLDEALKLARELEHVKDAGELAAYKGFTHKQLGQRDEAITWLRAGYVLQAAAGSTTEMESTLRHLAQLHRDAGEGDDALECYRIMRQHCRTLGDRAGEMRANLRMGETYWMAERHADALTLFEEGLRLAREVGDIDAEQTCVAVIAKLRGEGADLS
jgi:tetratricopeptide (TPR) repeat protein